MDQQDTQLPGTEDLAGNLSGNEDTLNGGSGDGTGTSNVADQHTEETDEQKNARIAAEAATKAAERQQRAQSRVNQRFAELTAEKRAAEQRAADAMALAQQAIQRTAGPASQQQADPWAAPTREQFESYEDFVVAKAVHQNRVETARMMQAREQQFTQEAQQRSAQAQEAAVTRAYAERYAKAAAAIPDFAETMEDADIQVPNTVAAMLRSMEDGPLVAYHLQKNPAIVARFGNANPMAQAVILGEIAASLKTSSTATQSAAPAPGKPVGSGSGGSGNADAPPEDIRAYKAWAAKHMR